MLKNIKNLLISLLTVFKHLLKKPVTLEYPEKKNLPNQYFRGKPVLSSNCVCCRTCIKVCPAGAIKIEGNLFKIDLKRCIFCGNCSFYCPKNALKMSDCYELATEQKNELELTYEIQKEGNECERNR